MTIYDMKAMTIDGKEIQLSRYTGKVIIIVNTASKCGFTPQYRGLENLYQKYRDQGLEILGFPSNEFAGQEPGTNEEVHEFCSRNYGVTFQMFEKSSVRGTSCHPIFAWLTARQKFRGFDLKHPAAAILDEMLREKHPEFMGDDSIKWNFTKFLIDRTGAVIGRYEPPIEPMKIESTIVAALGNSLTGA